MMNIEHKASHSYVMWPLPLLAALAAGAGASAAPMEPANGYITVMRTVPAHDAFRPGDIGEPTNIATSRADLVVSATGALAPAVASVSDHILGQIGGQVSAGETAPRGAGAAGTLPREVSAVPLGGAGAGAGAASTGGASGVGGAITRAMAPLGGALSGALNALQGAK